MDDVQAQLEELKRLLVNQKAEIAALKGSALDPSDLAELQEAARLAEVQQALAEEMRLAESRTFGALSKTHEAAQFGRALKEFKRKLAQRSERAEKHRRLRSAVAATVANRSPKEADTAAVRAARTARAAAGVATAARAAAAAGAVRATTAARAAVVVARAARAAAGAAQPSRTWMRRSHFKSRLRLRGLTRRRTTRRRTSAPR